MCNTDAALKFTLYVYMYDTTMYTLPIWIENKY